MTPDQIFRLCVEFASGRPLQPYIDHFAQVYNLTPGQIAKVRELAEKRDLTG